MNTEEWRPVSLEGYESAYEVSNRGRVRSRTRLIPYTVHNKQFTRTQNGRMLKMQFPSRYATVMLCKPGTLKTVKTVRVDYLVASAFLPNPHNYECVIHEDGNSRNNNDCNLRWAEYCGEPYEQSVQWRPVPGFADLYMVSSCGEIRSITRIVGRKRSKGVTAVSDAPTFKSKLLKPYRYMKKSGVAVYHLHRRHKPGRNGQTDVYVHIDDLVRSVFNS